MASVLLYTTSEQTMAVVEAERRRLANLLQRDVVAALNLLLSQAQAYEQSVGSNPTAHTAVSVLTTLARQALQQVRDLEANLHPTTLNSLGLEPALETLAGQSTRRHGLEVTVNAGRMRDRLPSPFELALFRVAQEALEGAAGAGASRAQMQLAQEEDQIRFSFEDDGRARPTGETLQATCRRLEQLGGVAHRRFDAA
jgi:signal transduction histidine kinase